MKFLFATWWVFGVIVSVVYAAHLVALTAVSRRTVPIKSLEDLATQTHTKVASQKGVAVNGMLKVPGVLVFLSVTRWLL